MALTLDTIRAAQERLAPLMFGFQVSVIAVRIGPVRLHAKRRNGGKVSYHERVQKKWIRRWGMADRTPLRPGEVCKFKNPFGGRDSLYVRADDVARIEALSREDAL